MFAVSNGVRQDGILSPLIFNVYFITPIFRVESIFAIFAYFDFARNVPSAKIISTAKGISRNFPPAKFSFREFFLHAKIKILMVA